MLAARHTVAAAALAAVLALTACGDELIHWIDPPIRLSGEAGDAIGGPASLDVGFTTSAGYTSLADDDGLVVIHGLQGGTWTMPTVRTRGVASFALVTCTITTAAGERVGAVDARTRFFPSADGPLEVAGLPIPVNHADPDLPIDDLYGQRAALDCAVEDDAGQRAEAAFDVTLEAG